MFKWGKKKTPFPTREKGEINELKAQFRDPAAERDPLKKRDALKQVISFMTLGIDTTALAPEVIMAAATKDLVTKKMVYLYMAAHADASPEISLLAINTLQKDCRDESPIVRGLALRTISSLRVAGVVEYLAPLLQRSLTDPSTYVKKTAVFAALKLFRADREQYDSLALTDRITAMVRDPSSDVSMAAVCALEEILADDGGMVLTKHLVYFLLNRIRELTEWQQCAVMQLVVRYPCENDEEMFNVMNLLEERLRGSNSAVILAAVRLFLNMTLHNPKVHKQVYLRVKEPLLTLFATASTETSFAVLAHLKLLISREPAVYHDSYKDFFIRMNDPTYMKELKMETLVLVASDASVATIVDEMVAYASDLVPEMCRKAIRSLGALCLKLPSAAPLCVPHFVEFLETDIAHLRAETFVVLKDVVRKYRDPAIVAPLLALVPTAGKHLEELEARVAFVFLLGECGRDIPEAPYLLEDLVATWEEHAASLALEILTACTKLFFARPPEMQRVLGSALSQAIEENTHVEVHDRALMYYRLLRQGPEVAQRVVAADKELLQRPSEEENQELKDKLFEEFNSLSVIYGLPASRFIVSAPGVLGADSDDEAVEEEDGDEEEAEADALEAQMLTGPESPVVKTKSRGGKLLLCSEPEVDEAAFQGKWETLPVTETVEIQLKAQPHIDLVEGTLSRNNIICLAGGMPDGVLKGYFYAQPGAGVDQPHYLAEIVVDVSGKMTATVKSDADRVPQFVQLLREAVQRFC
eukprot:TRINITY_DN2161_c0_g1_i1.p1 TRINITY_DN2161_c0_g1~~TRINITY_DN2161_c0_g1_i1.p1  ORF type:complete len:756 (-),score=211.04 TRINITY_DN2161_c0_g1_i1:88-2355(-)